MGKQARLNANQSTVLKAAKESGQVGIVVHGNHSRLFSFFTSKSAISCADAKEEVQKSCIHLLARAPMDFTRLDLPAYATAASIFLGMRGCEPDGFYLVDILVGGEHAAIGAEKLSEEEWLSLAM